jgi:septal ring factor EnvC (AmiA/AmiB activator)
MKSKDRGYLNMKKRYVFPFFFLPVPIWSTGCVCMTHKELCARNEEIKTIKIDLQLKEKTITELLDRLSMKDQEIGKLTDELYAAQMTIEDLKHDIERLREVDVQVEEKKKEVDDSMMEETISATVPETAPGSESITAEGQENK